MKIRQNKKYTEIAIYVVITVVTIYILSKVADNSGSILKTLGKWLGILAGILAPLIAGFIMYYLLIPLVKFFQEKLGKLAFYKKRNKTPRGMAVAVTLLIIAVTLIAGLSVLISSLTHQASLINLDDLTKLVESLADSLKGMYLYLENWLNKMNIASDQLKQAVQSLTTWLGDFAANIGNNLTNSVSNLTGFFANAIFAIILCIYFLLDDERLARYWDGVLKALTPHKFYEQFHVALDDADYVFSGYIRGQMIDACLMAIMISIALSIIPVRYSVVIGILSGIGNLIPYVGPVIAYVLTAAICLIDGDLTKLVIAVVVLFVIQTIDGNVINPRLLSQNTDVHPMLVIIALLFGSSIGGILGMLLAVPVAALIKIWFDRFIGLMNEKRKQRKEQEDIMTEELEQAENK